MNSQQPDDAALLQYRSLISSPLLYSDPCPSPQSHKANRNNDLQGLTLTLAGQHTYQPDCDQNQHGNDGDLHRRIQEYNKVAKTLKKQQDKDSRRRRNRQEEGKTKRKVRTTITPDKLEDMNKIFWKFQQGKDRVKQEAPVDEGFLNLKSIGQKLGLGYSTILHKYREYRATKKVKGGALLASLNQKRKYKKSRQIEELIERSLSQGKFYTAVDLSRYIQQKFGRTLSRSIISRHLGEMGYSYKNTKSKSSKDCPQLKEMRKKFITAIAYLRKVEQCPIFYIDEFVFSPHEGQQQDFYGNINLTILVSADGVLKYEINDHMMYQQQFSLFLRDFIDQIDGDPTKPKIIVMDMENHLHFSEEVMAMRKGQMKDKNIRLFYLPPNSSQLNLLEWVIPDLKAKIESHVPNSHEGLQQDLEEGLAAMRGTSLDSCMKKMEEYQLKGLRLQCFE